MKPITVIPGRRDAANPESRAKEKPCVFLDSGPAPSVRPGMTGA
jgi:hypothetical protein